jgi:hypothetical protein
MPITTAGAAVSGRGRFEKASHVVTRPEGQEIEAVCFLSRKAAQTDGETLRVPSDCLADGRVNHQRCPFLRTNFFNSIETQHG